MDETMSVTTPMPLQPTPPRSASAPGSVRAHMLEMPQRVPRDPADARSTRRRLWDAASGRFDPGRLREEIVSRGWTVPEFVVASRVSRSCVYKALRGYAVGDRTVVRVLRALDSRPATGLLDD